MSGINPLTTTATGKFALKDAFLNTTARGLVPDDGGTQARMNVDTIAASPPMCVEYTKNGSARPFRDVRP